MLSNGVQLPHWMTVLLLTDTLFLGCASLLLQYRTICPYDTIWHSNCRHSRCTCHFASLAYRGIHMDDKDSIIETQWADMYRSCKELKSINNVHNIFIMQQANSFGINAYLQSPKWILILILNLLLCINTMSVILVALSNGDTPKQEICMMEVWLKYIVLSLI